MRLITAAAKMATSTEHSSRSTPSQAASRASRLPREHLIEAIVRVSPGATADFLARFGDDALRHYLDRLDSTEQPRGRQSFWVRRPETAAFNTLEPAV